MTNTTPTHTATTVTAITTITDISLAKLVPSPANVRRTGAGTGIEALAASIQAHGLLQSLVVRPQLDANGQETDCYEVVAGGRRLAALRLLAKRKRIAKGTAIPCRVELELKLPRFGGRSVALIVRRSWRFCCKCPGVGAWLAGGEACVSE